MSEDEIKKWMNGGMEIGAHTQNHIFANLMELEGISTKDVYTKTYFMS
jgi:hypothetical protein